MTDEERANRLASAAWARDQSIAAAGAVLQRAGQDFAVNVRGCWLAYLREIESINKPLDPGARTVP